MKELNMYIPVRDETNYMIKYYQYLFNKYWGKHIRVYFLGYKRPEFELEENMYFVSLAEERDPSPEAWSGPLVDFFDSIEDEYFYFSLEDLLILRPVDIKLIEICKEMMNPTVGRIDLWNSIQFDPNRRNHVHYFKSFKDVAFCKLNQAAGQAAYRVSCSNSIWNRKWFLKTLEKGWSSLDWEVKANDGRHHNDGYDVLATVDRWTPTVVHSLCRHWRGKTNVYGMLDVDKQKLLELSTEDEKRRFYEVTNAVTVINLNYGDTLRDFWDHRFSNNKKKQRFHVGSGFQYRESPDDNAPIQGYQPNINHVSNIKM